MKKLLLATAATALGTAAVADDVKIGVLLGFTGPLESLAPAIGDAAEMAIAEVSASGALLDGATVMAVRGDSTCIDAGAGTAAAERLVTSDEVDGIVGAMCSGNTGAILTNVAMPNGMVMFSPSATSPALSEVEDDGLFFRAAPSDARQGEVMAQILMDQGTESVAVTYTNNDYGKGLADSFESAYTALGGEVTISAAHEDDKADYSAEVGALASAGGDVLVVLGYADKGGAGVMQAALDQGAFDQFHLADGMISSTITDAFGTDIEGSTGQHPSARGDGAGMFAELVGDAFDPTSPYAGEAYDAAALLMLAMQAAGSADPSVYKDKVFDVANAPGEVIHPGDLARALELIAAGEEVNYEGVTAIELIGPGESSGAFREVVIEDGAFTEVGFH